MQDKRAPQKQYAAVLGDPLSVPSGIHVFATQRHLSTDAHQTIDATWAQSRACATAEDAQAVKDTSYKACLQLGKLLLVVVWWPLGDRHLFVSADGAGYIIEAGSRTLVETIGTEVAGVMRDEAMTLSRTATRRASRVNDVCSMTAAVRSTRGATDHVHRQTAGAGLLHPAFAFAGQRLLTRGECPPDSAYFAPER